MKKGYTLRLMIAIDQVFNVLLLNGSEDHTIRGSVTSTTLVTRNKRWLYAEKIINTLFWFDKDHCRESIEYDEIRDK